MNPPSVRESAMSSKSLRLLLLLTLLLGLLLVPSVRAEDEGDDDGADDDAPIEVGPGVDLGDQNVPFAEQVNRAIDLGSTWLRAKPQLFTIPGTDGEQGAHWGFIRGDRLYGGGEGKGYGHPAGTTALALYTLLKCGASPKDPVIKAGFNWLSSFHKITPEWDDRDTGARERYWFLAIGATSYELSVMILALTAKYDPHKKSSQSEVIRRRGKLKIKNKDDRVWLTQLVDALIARRGQPATGAIPLDKSTLQRLHDTRKEEPYPEPPESELPPRSERRAWRYNPPNLNLTASGGGGRTKSTDSFGISGAPGVHGNEDLSSTQLAALALFAAHQFGVKIPLDVWEDVIEFTLDYQEPEGPEHVRHDPGNANPPRDRARGFVYLKGSPERSEGVATGSMTACGVANLLMAKQVLGESSKGRKLWSERGWDRTVDMAIWDGLAWLDKNWSSFANPVKNGYHTYYLYSIERAQDLRGKNLIGTHAWYPEGAKQLLSRAQAVKVADPVDERAPEKDGVFWNTNSTHDPKDVLDTCFALLFLKRATRGVAPGPITPADGRPVDNR